MFVVSITRIAHNYYIYYRNIFASLNNKGDATEIPRYCRN